MSMNPTVSRRSVVALSAAALAATATPRNSYAEKTGTVDILPSSDALEFLYIDCKESEAGKEQNVALSLRDQIQVGGATLSLENVDTAATQDVPVTKTAGSSLLFTFTPQEAGTYQISSLALTSDSPSTRIDFSDADASFRSFVVSYGIATFSLDSDTSSNEAAPQLQVYSDDASGDVTQGTSIEDATKASLAFSSPKARSIDRSATTVIALDPGHVGCSSGAVANGIAEASATWKIAQACAAALNAYNNVSVFFTATPSDRLGSNELQVRVDRAVAKGAAILVSLHLNSMGDGSAYGAEVWAPYNADYQSDTHAVGTNLGNKIIDELKRLGLFNRGVKFRWISGDPDYQYSNGNNGDYYGIIRNARRAGLPAIIVEHAFIDNWGDYTRFLNSDEKLQALGNADANGIINALGLTKEQGVVYRLYSEVTKEHLFTRDANEYRVLAGRNWKQEGRAWRSPDSSSTPVYRLYSEVTKEHLYTKDANEYRVLGSRGWKQEDVAWYSDDAESVPVYRLYHEGIKRHHYTKDTNEYNTLAGKGWKREGIAWYSLD